ncbi:MAG: HK97 family phage prohead protease [Prevotella sp.]|jgi:HK97 family phage prohead protease|nr:HK97 family phage prohead protease [Prevotella sp.]
MNKKEVRNTGYQVTVSDGEESRKVEGYALLFDTKSDGLSFEEVIERGALDGVLEKSDVLTLMNHDPYRGVLARWKKQAGSLNLSVDTKGLKYEFDAPKTSLGDELLENIRRGEVDSSSFAFTVEKDMWEKKSNGTWKRTINKIERLYDVSPVYNAAYSKTSVYMRSANDDQIDAQSLVDEQERMLQESEARKKEADITAFYDSIEKSFNKL